MQAAGLMGKVFLTQHSSLFGLADGTVGSTDSSIPQSPILDAFTCQDLGM